MDISYCSPLPDVVSYDIRSSAASGTGSEIQEIHEAAQEAARRVATGEEGSCS